MCTSHRGGRGGAPGQHIGLVGIACPAGPGSLPAWSACSWSGLAWNAGQRGVPSAGGTRATTGCKCVAVWRRHADRRTVAGATRSACPHPAVPAPAEQGAPTARRGHGHLARTAPPWSRSTLHHHRHRLHSSTEVRGSSRHAGERQTRCATPSHGPCTPPASHMLSYAAPPMQGRGQQPPATDGGPSHPVGLGHTSVTAAPIGPPTPRPVLRCPP